MAASVALAVGKGTARAVGQDLASVTLPQLQVPAGTPPFLRDGHGQQLMSVYGDQPMQTGAARRRRIYLSAPRTATLSLELNLLQMQNFNDWFEKPLQVGSAFISLQVANLGPGLMWWKSRILTKSSEYLGGQFWKVTLTVMLFGLGSVNGPVPSSMQGGIFLRLVGTAGMVVPQPISGGVRLALVTSSEVTYLAGNISLVLVNAAYVAPPSIATASGISIVLGVARVNAGVSTGVSTALGVGRAIMNAVGSSSGSALAAGVYPLRIGVGTAAGSSTAQATLPSSMSARLREGGGYRLREDGSYRLRES